MTYNNLAKKTRLMKCRKVVAEAGRRSSFHRQDAGLEALDFSNEISHSFLQIIVGITFNSHYKNNKAINLV